jgi:hypothetical protein
MFIYGARARTALICTSFRLFDAGPPEGHMPMFIPPLIFRRFSTTFAILSLLSPVTRLTRQPPVAMPSRVQTEIAQIRADNAAIRDELRKLEDRQRVLLLRVRMLQQVCDGSSAPLADGGTNHADAAPNL